MPRPTKEQREVLAAIEVAALTALDDLPSHRLAAIHFKPLLEARLAEGWVLMTTMQLPGGFTRLVWRRGQKKGTTPSTL